MKRLYFFGLAISILCVQDIGAAFVANGQSTTTQEKPQATKSASETKRAVQAESANQDQETPGIAIGETLPAISLKKQDGTDVSIQNMLKKGPVALVFYRSAVW